MPITSATYKFQDGTVLSCPVQPFTQTPTTPGEDPVNILVFQPNQVVTFPILFVYVPTVNKWHPTGSQFMLTPEQMAQSYVGWSQIVTEITVTE